MGFWPFAPPFDNPFNGSNPFKAEQLWFHVRMARIRCASHDRILTRFPVYSQGWAFLIGFSAWNISPTWLYHYLGFKIGPGSNQISYWWYFMALLVPTWTGALMQVAAGVLGWFPMPFSTLWTGVLAMPAEIVVLYFSIPKAKRRQPGFCCERFKHVMILIKNVLEQYVIYAFYRLGFEKSGPIAQHFVTLGLPILKHGLMHRNREQLWKTKKKDLPPIWFVGEYFHAFFMATLFTRVKSIGVVVLLVSFDLIDNAIRLYRIYDPEAEGLAVFQGMFNVIRREICCNRVNAGQRPADLPAPEAVELPMQAQPDLTPPVTAPLVEPGLAAEGRGDSDRDSAIHHATASATDPAEAPSTGSTSSGRSEPLVNIVAVPVNPVVAVPVNPRPQRARLPAHIENSVVGRFTPTKRIRYHRVVHAFLGEWVETFVPLQYLTMMCFIYNSYQRDIFYGFDTMDQGTFERAVVYLLILFAFELASFILVGWILWRTMKIDFLMVGHFVVKQYATLIFSSMATSFTIVLVLVQKHYGFDFSFEFSWL